MVNIQEAPRPFPAQEQDWAAIISLLTSNSLPVEDLGSKIDLFVWKENEQLLALGGWEKYGKIALLRSVVMSKENAGKGYGKKWVHALLSICRQAGIEDVYLLATTAAGFFQKLDFQIIQRTQVPNSIKQTTEFSSLCPDSAIVMHKRIKNEQ